MERDTVREITIKFSIPWTTNYDEFLEQLNLTAEMYYVETEVI
jgi:hypothetical protein